MNARNKRIAEAQQRGVSNQRGKFGFRQGKSTEYMLLYFLSPIKSPFIVPILFPLYPPKEKQYDKHNKLEDTEMQTRIARQIILFIRRQK